MHCNEAVVTEANYSDTPAVANVFLGRELLVSNIYGMKTGKEFITTLENNVCKCGAMDK
jgi:hypothetical protein